VEKGAENYLFFFFGSLDGSLIPDLKEGEDQLEITPLNRKEC
jgi:hypothetical protein